MRLITGQTELSSLQERPLAVTLGKFDGLHKGHRKLIGQVLKAGEEEGGIWDHCFLRQLRYWLCS